MALEFSKDKIAGSEAASISGGQTQASVEVENQVGKETASPELESSDIGTSAAQSSPPKEVLPAEYNIEALRKGSPDNSSTWFGNSLARTEKVSGRSQ